MHQYSMASISLEETSLWNIFCATTLVSALKTTRFQMITTSSGRNSGRKYFTDYDYLITSLSVRLHQHITISCLHISAINLDTYMYECMSCTRVWMVKHIRECSNWQKVFIVPKSSKITNLLFNNILLSIKMIHSSFPSLVWFIHGSGFWYIGTRCSLLRI